MMKKATHKPHGHMAGGKDIGMEKRPSARKGGAGEKMPQARGNKLAKEAGEMGRKNASSYSIEKAPTHGMAKR